MSLLEGLYNLAVLGRPRDDPGPFDPQAVKKILVVRNDNIGDVICTTPALDALRRAFPRAHIAALVCTLAQEAIEGHRALDAVYAYPKAKHKQHGAWESLRRLGSVLAQVRRERFDLVRAARASCAARLGGLAHASRGRWRLGPRAQGKRARWGFYYNLPTDPPPPGVHEVLRCFHLLQYIQVDSPKKRLYLKVPAQARAKAEAFLEEHGLGGRRGPVVVNITRWAYRPDRAWPEEKYRRLVSALAQGPGGVAVTHAPADRDWAAARLVGPDPYPAVFWSACLMEVAALVARARVFVTAEGGPMHLAAAVGAPLAVLWGRTPREVWSPWGARCVILGGGAPVSGIGVDQVLDAVERLRKDRKAKNQAAGDAQ